MAMLRTPFYDKKIFNLMKLICSEKHERISGDEYSDELKNLADNLLKKDPKKRPSLRTPNLINYNF